MKTSARLLCLFLLTLLITASFTLAGDFELNRATLEGIQGVNVVVESFPPTVEQAGLTRAAIQTAAELKLRLAGIQVMTIEEAAARLYISVDAMTKNAPWAYHISVELLQEVGLNRTDEAARRVDRTDQAARRFARIPANFSFMAPTWSVEELGTVGPSAIADLRGSINDLTDRFLNAYLSVNAKK